MKRLLIILMLFSGCADNGGLPDAVAEYAAVSWLDLMGSVTRSFVFTFGDVPSMAMTGPVSATMGAGAHWGSFRLEATVMNEFFENGPDFIGGNGNGISSFVSAYYTLD